MSSSWETLWVDGSDMPVYMTMPQGDGPFPAVVVIQAADGVDEFIQTVAGRLADEGYAGLAPSNLPDQQIATACRSQSRTEIVVQRPRCRAIER